MGKSHLELLEDEDLGEWQKAMLFQNIERTQLSNERNFLNWVRTSLAFITLGFVVQRFDFLLDGAGDSVLARVSPLVTTWVPLLFFILGGLVVALGAWDFFRLRREINTGTWFDKGWIRDALIVITMIFLLAILVIFIVGKP